MSVCNCPVTIGNTGKPGCVPLLDITKYAFLMNTYAQDGTRNGITIGDVVNQAYITARINEIDPSKRWYPTLKLFGVTDERADPITETIDNIDYITEESPRLFMGMSPKATYVYLAKLKSGECTQLSIYNGDDNNRLSGTVGLNELSVPTFYPHIIEDGTFYCRLTKPQVGVVQKVSMQFVYSTLEKDENIDLYTTTANFASTAASGGLLDVRASFTNQATTGFTATLTTDYGTANNTVYVKGLLLSDFVLYNNTTLSAVVITSVDEVYDGVYDFVIPAQTALDVLELTDVKNGIELIAEVTL